jgi:hypothetical protein
MYLVGQTRRIPGRSNKDAVRIKQPPRFVHGTTKRDARMCVVRLQPSNQTFGECPRC